MSPIRKLSVGALLAATTLLAACGSSSSSDGASSAPSSGSSSGSSSSGSTSGTCPVGKWQADAKTAFGSQGGSGNTQFSGKLVWTINANGTATYQFDNVSLKIPEIQVDQGINGTGKGTYKIEGTKIDSKINSFDGTITKNGKKLTGAEYESERADLLADEDPQEFQCTNGKLVVDGVTWNKA